LIRSRHSWSSFTKVRREGHSGITLALRRIGRSSIWSYLTRTGSRLRYLSVTGPLAKVTQVEPNPFRSVRTRITTYLYGRRPVYHVPRLAAPSPARRGIEPLAISALAGSRPDATTRPRPVIGSACCAERGGQRRPARRRLWRLDRR
jgi:hypothetical protein